MDYACGKATSRARLLVGSFLGCGAGEHELEVGVNHRQRNPAPHLAGGDLFFPKKITSRVKERLEKEVLVGTTG